MSCLRLILADQLTETLPIVKDCAKGDAILMVEVREEATYVKHHKKKIAFLFSAMRHFAETLKKRKHDVRYTKYDDEDNTGSLFAEVERALQDGDFDKVLVTEPGEYRLLDDMESWHERLECDVEILPDTRFIATREEFSQWAEGKKQLVMEYWYREMRAKTDFLMEGNEPAGGKWNYDKDNRKPIKGEVDTQGPREFKPDTITRDVLELVEEYFSAHFGSLEPFWFAVTASQAEEALEHFIEHSLPSFGDYQDAMQTGEPFLFHSLLSQYINCGLLDPMAVCEKVEQAYHDGHAPLNAAEGFIRQIIGWREYVRGIYWHLMPDYADRNALNATRALPDFYWHGKTKMRCLSEVIHTTEKHACSHHIQRLMVTGNFANLCGLDVESVCDWYLAVYADAYEWVELPNTLGMALYADKGVLGTKPYVSGGAYINRMSDFCKHCEYNVKKRTGDDACPFNYLYWNYLMQHQQMFRKNHRMAMIYKTLDRFDDKEQQNIQAQAEEFLSSLH